jgi:hypothetical protein
MGIVTGIKLGKGGVAPDGGILHRSEKKNILELY